MTPTTNQSPQNQIPDVMASSSPMQRPNHDPPPPPPHHLPLKCPRCDSSNTKFCYYNNYSLSQPRHFCKACKRYWTRGGTLRNVPVGGGCRKNKRPKRQSSAAADGASSSAAAAANPSVQPQIDLTSPAVNRMHNPLFYNPIELNFPFSSYSSPRVSSEFDLQSQLNGLGLGFSSGLSDYKSAYKPIQDMINSASSSPFSVAGNTNSTFFGSSSFASSSAMASLLASSVHDGKSVMQYHDGGNGANMGKDVKQERENGSVWNPNPNPNHNHIQNQIEQINPSDPSSFLWSTTNLSAWFDPSSMGSSVPSLI